MIISQCTGGTLRQYGYKKGLKMFKDAGFEYVDFSFHAPGADYPNIFDDNGETAQKIREEADRLGIRFNQAHAPFASYRHGDEEYNTSTFKKIARSIELSEILGIPVIIVHPFCYPDRKNHMEENLEFYRRLLPYAKKTGVRIAIENMWGYDDKRGYITTTAFSFAEDLLEFKKKINSEYITVCLDVGHSALVGREPQDEILKLGKELGALHVHDTDYKSDLHTLCYFGKQMWSDISKSLGEIGYDGDFTYECSLPSSLPEELVPSVLRLMHDTAEYLVSEIEKNRK